MDLEGIQPEWGQPSAVREGTSRQHQVAGPNPASGPDPTPPLNEGLNEDLTLALLERRDLAPESLEQLGHNTAAMRSRKICVALVAHPRAPRHLALRLLRQFHTFDLMKFALQPAAAADLKHVADERIVARLASITLGERLTLARRASRTVAAALLLDKDSRVSHTALENSRLTEAAVSKALVRPNAPAAFVEAVCHHPKWSLRREIRMTLLRNPHTPLARALEFARTFPPPLLRDVLHNSRLPDNVKTCLRNHPKERP
jgi:hypothetical protein